MSERIIEIYLSDDGNVQYKLRTTLLSTEQYGHMLVELAMHIATMMADEGGFNKGIVYSQILTHMAERMDGLNPPSDVARIH